MNGNTEHTQTHVHSEHPLEKIAADGLCMGCGFCQAPLEGGQRKTTIKVVFNATLGHYAPRVYGWRPGDPVDPFTCPGVKLDMPALAQAKHGAQPDDPILGTYRKLMVCHAADSRIHERSASGGVIPAILSHLFKTGAIEAAYCLTNGDSPNGGVGRVIRSPEEISQIHGSVYHPVNFGAGLMELLNGAEKFAFVGLPCHVAGMEALKQKIPKLADRLVITLGLFCGGVNTFGGMAYYLEKFGIEEKDIEQITYRDGAWPGKMKVTMKSTKESRLIPRIRGNTRWRILRYMIGFQGYWMLKRCRLCPDQVNDFADIAVGDPHLPKYRKKGGHGFSILVGRTSEGESVMNDMLREGELVGEQAGHDEIVESQGYTLDNRRHVPAYVRIARALNTPTPDITVYDPVLRSVKFRHYKYAAVDLMKILIPKNKLTRALYIPWQIFEYSFITLAPMLIMKRLGKLFTNK